MNEVRTYFSIVTFLFALLVSTTSVGQAKINGADTWEQLYAGQGITVEYKKDRCTIPADGSDIEEIYLKFTNTSDKLIYVDWQFDVTYGDKCYNCDGGLDEMSQRLKLSPKQSVRGECGDYNDLRLRIFSKFLNMENPTVLEGFNVKAIVVKELQE